MSVAISISIVSHGHHKYLVRLLEDLVRLNRTDIELILTLNIPEALAIDLDSLPFSVRLIKNEVPKGFAANHNAAFIFCQSDYFVILNPDIRLAKDPFDDLLILVKQNPNCICAPLIANSQGLVEDSARNFPSPYLLLKKFLGKIFNRPLPLDAMLHSGAVIKPDWVAGMFILVPRPIYEKLQGLSERFFLYYEDVDFSARARLAGFEILVSTDVKVVHEAQRDSHRKLRYLLMHIMSALKFFISGTYMKIHLKRWMRTS